MSTKQHIRTPDEVRAEFDRLGISIAGWARKHGFTRGLVYEVLARRKKCKRGNSHKIAVLLGLKDGVITDN